MKEESTEEQAEPTKDSEAIETIEADGEPVSQEAETVREEERVALVEALILANGEPIELVRLTELTGINSGDLEEILEEIRQKYLGDEHGFELLRVAGNKLQFRTKGRYADYVQKLKAGRPRRLSPAALETLAIVAYRQPIVRSDIEQIRGVDPTPTLKTLLERGIVRIVGHQATVGQPALYGTTDEFLKLFGLNSLAELPTLRDLKELDEDPGEVDEEYDDDEFEASDDQDEEQAEASEVVNEEREDADSDEESVAANS